MSQELATLIKKRSAMKARLTKFKTFLDKFLNKTEIQESSILELDQRLNKLTCLSAEFDTAQLDIEVLSADLDEQIDERESWDSTYYGLVSVAKTTLSKYTVSSEQNDCVRTETNDQSNIRLPQISLPKFSGLYEQWSEYRDTFMSLIHLNSSIGGIQKFHYLRASLEGSAAEVIHSLVFSESNYTVAWDLLCERYDNKKLIVHTHLKSLFNLKPIQRETANDIRKLLDEFSKHVRSLDHFKQPTRDTLIIYLVTSKLDKATAREWEEFEASSEFPTLDELRSFLKGKSDLLEKIESNIPVETKFTRNPTKQRPQAFHAKSSITCAFCKASHLIYHCGEFLKLNPNSRLEQVKNLRLCINCLRPGHGQYNCKSISCRKCNTNHHTLLHFEKPRREESQQQASVALTSHNHKIVEEVFWPTARIQILDKRGRTHHCVALLDSGSQSNFITTKLSKILNLETTQINIEATGVDQIKTKIHGRCSTTIGSTVNAFSAKLSFLMVKSISARLPSVQVDTSHLQIPNHLKLADPQFNIPKNIDLLIGNKLFFKLLCIGQISVGSDALLQKTKLGWIVTGGTDECASLPTQCHFTSQTDVQQQLQKFWEIEDSPKTKHFSPDEVQCENHFVDTVSRDNTGRFIVSVPFNKSIKELGDTRLQAMRRFLGLERRLQSDSELKSQYLSFMQEYEMLGHMSQISETDTPATTYYLPHHGVLRKDSLTTKLRVVFDGSATSSTGTSLNDLQLVGPVIQQDLLSIMLRFRQHRYAFTADIAKMYRQVLLTPEQRPLQRILWRNNPNEALSTFQLNTITYGTASASFLAIRCLFELANINSSQFPRACQVIKNDFYVDDLITGADTLEEAHILSQKVYYILQQGGFELRKWVSSQSSLTFDFGGSNGPNDIVNIGSDASKTLGLLWLSNDDHLAYDIKHQRFQVSITKRLILSKIAHIFDPLGLVSPSTVIAKIILQKLWQLKLSWDESIPASLHTDFLQFYDQLAILNQIRVPRHILCVEPTLIEIHGFSDASEQAYGCCIYARSVNNSGHIFSKLICAKSKVAPLKAISIPRLELCGALLLAQLSRKVLESTTLDISNTYLWSDSTIVLAWIKTSPHLLKTFVANRVAEIQTLSSIVSWNHVSTNENPADLVSRGANPSDLKASKLWWHGPSWLATEKSSWPELPTHRPLESIPELRNTTTNIFNIIISPSFIFKRFSNLTQLQRVVALCLRFKFNTSQPYERRTFGSLTTLELSNALNNLLKLSQSETFSSEIEQIQNASALKQKCSLLALNPFIDPQGMMRVGGRLQHSSFTYEKKHPVILSGKHTLTRLIFLNEHKRLLHAGPQLLLSSVRERYWPLSGRNLARQTVRGCVTCFRVSPKALTPIMGQLPSSRLHPTTPFSITGVDYAGPFLIKNKDGRGSKTYKGYICLFICFATKAMHLELVSDLTTESFIATLRRFVSRRGKPSHIYSDNGTNFVGANHELASLGSFLGNINNKDLIQRRMSNDGIQWHFIPAHSPHFGGIWEAGVKSAKSHLKRVVGNANLTFENFYTILTQIEAVLNSRPLSPLTTDPSDLNPLTPAHFLIGKPLTGVPDPDVRPIPENRLSKYQHLQQLLQHYWSRWSKEYVSELQQRCKWKRDHKSLLKVGAMVIIREENLPPLKWQLGRVEELHPGADGVLRVATIRTHQGILKRRCISKLCALPMESED